MQQSREGAASFTPTCRPAANWWDAYVKTHEELDTINWNEFKMDFRSHHVPQGLIKLKKKDGSEARIHDDEYVTRFMQLSCYAPNDVDIDEKK
jgi:hypothetical protein